MDPLTMMAIGQGLGAIGGGVGGMLQGNRSERRGYKRATKQRKHGLSLLGVGEWGAIHSLQQDVGNRALTAEDFAKIGIKPGESSYADLVMAGGIPGLRKQFQKEALANLEGGYKGAEEALRGGAQEAKGSIYGQREKGMADVTTNLQQAGLQSSNIAQQAMANVSYQAGKSLSEIDTALGGSMADLRLSKSTAMDAVLARNLGLDEQTMNELMGFLVGPSGYGPNASSQYFSGMGGGFQSPNVDMGDVGAGISDIFNMFGSLGMFDSKGSALKYDPTPLMTGPK